MRSHLSNSSIPYFQTNCHEKNVEDVEFLPVENTFARIGGLHYIIHIFSEFSVLRTYQVQTLLCDIPDFEVFTSIFNLYSVCFIKNSKLWQEDNIFIKKGHRCVSKWNPHPCSFWIILRESICYRMKINHPNLYLFNFNGLQDISRPMFQNLFSFSQINLE